MYNCIEVIQLGYDIDIYRVVSTHLLIMSILVNMNMKKSCCIRVVTHFAATSICSHHEMPWGIGDKVLVSFRVV